MVSSSEEPREQYELTDQQVAGAPVLAVEKTKYRYQVKDEDEDEDNARSLEDPEAEAFLKDSSTRNRTISTARRLTHRHGIWWFCGISILTITILAVLLILRGYVAYVSDALPWIDPLIGTSNGGHVFPGANIPYGMVKAVADCRDDNAGGYSTDNVCKVIGFSHTHDSGTGGATSFGNFRFFPQTGCNRPDLFGCVAAIDSPEVPNSTVATPGYFAIQLENGVSTEITATSHTALYRFTFTKQDDLDLEPLIHVNLRDLYGSLSNGNVSVADDGRMRGWGEYQPSFGPAVWRFFVGDHRETYRLHFCADFNTQVKSTGTWDGSSVLPDNKVFTTTHSDAAGAYVQFDGESDAQMEIMTRVGISFVSEEQACSNAEQEIPGFDFARARDAATSAWEDKFRNIYVDSEGVSNETLTGFWSGIYRTMLSPQNYTGENPLWESDEPYFDSFYCIWDSFRSTDPFLNILDPDAHTLMLRALLDIYKHEGKLPDCRMSLCKGDTQGGSNADVLVADALIKGLTKDVNWTLAYEAVQSDAEDEPADWSLEGRGNLESWKTLGYVPVDEKGKRRKRGEGLDSRSVSRTMEYAYDDYCVAQVAKSQGRMDDYKKYLQRSGNWRNVFDPDVRSVINDVDTGFQGFVQPRLLSGEFKYEDPALCSPVLGMSRACYLFESGFSTYEGGSWLYSFFVPHDMAALIDSMGGKETFAKRLQYFHSSGLADIGDEQAFLTVFQFHYAGRPGLSSNQAHYYLSNNFTTAKGGIPGNDDSGSMGSFLAFCMMGFFPNPGQDVYFLVAPWFREIRLTHPQTGNVAVIKTLGGDEMHSAHYIQSVKLNGRVYEKSWITHDFFTKGGVLEIMVGEEEGDWGTGEEALPPSLSTSGELEALNT